MKNIAELRAEAKAFRPRTTAKIARMRRNSDIDISGTSNDPRRSAAEINTMNSRQLNSYIRNQKKFLERNTGFVPIARGNNISRSLWQEFNRVSKKYNKLAESHFAEFSDLKVPGSKMTVAERNAAIVDRPAMGTEAVNRPLAPIYRKSTDFASEKAVRLKIKDMQRRMNPGYYDKAIRRGRAQANKMLKVIGDPNLSKWVRGLSAKEFDFLWFHGKLAHSLSESFNAAGGSPGSKEINMQGLDKGFQNVGETAVTEIMGKGGWKDVFDRFKKK